MKKLRMGICFLLIMVLVTCDCRLFAYADTSDGQNELSAIELTVGKTNTGKFQAGKSSVFFKVVLNENGKLKISLTAQKIASNVKIEVYNQTDELLFWSQNKTLNYNKSKKTISGSMTSDYILPKGRYIIRVTPESELKSAKKFKLTAKVTDTGYMDVEPNFPEANAQPMVVNSKSGTITYKMLLSNINTFNNADIIDCFTFKLKQSEQFYLKASFESQVDGLSVLVCKKKGDDIAVVKRYDVTGKKLDKSLKLGKGTYFVKVWYYGEHALQIPYTISGSLRQKVTAVKLNKSKLTLWIDKKYGATSAKLKATVSPSNATNKKLQWKSNKPKIAKVSSAGRVTALSVGKAVITVTALDGSKKYAKCEVVVKAPTPKISGPKSMTAGSSETFTTTVPGGTWKSSDKSILSCISADGKTVSVKALKAGTAVISYVANGVKSNKISVTVKEAPKKPTQPTKPSKPTQPMQPTQPTQPAPKIQGPGVVWVGQSITFTVTNGVSGGSWYSGDTSILSGSGGGTSCTMTGKKAGTTYVCYKVNGVESNRIQVQVRGL